MGFSDLLTSSRGPGVIGTLLALLVLVGFGTLYIFVFDEGLQGGSKKTIESVIREQALAIESNKDEIGRLEKQLASAQETKGQQQELEGLKTRLDLNKGRIAEAGTEREQTLTGIDATKVKWDQYKEAYRASEWAAAEGEALGDLKTLSGRSFTKVVITKVSHIGMEITDETGKRRIDSADLPRELQDRFQFDAQAKNVAAKKEDDTFKDLSDNVEIATLAKSGQDKLAQIAKLTTDIEQASGSIEDARSAEPDLLTRIDRLRLDLTTEEAKRNDRSNRRAQGIDKTPQIRDAISQAQKRVENNRNSIRDFERKITGNRNEISKLQGEVTKIKEDIAKIRKDFAAKQQQLQQQQQGAGAAHP
jgi:chromosome segregation ATPase